MGLVAIGDISASDTTEVALATFDVAQDISDPTHTSTYRNRTGAHVRLQNRARPWSSSSSSKSSVNLKGLAGLCNAPGSGEEANCVIKERGRVPTLILKHGCTIIGGSFLLCDYDH